MVSGCHLKTGRLLIYDYCNVPTMYLGKADARGEYSGHFCTVLRAGVYATYNLGENKWKT